MSITIKSKLLCMLLNSIVGVINIFQTAVYFAKVILENVIALIGVTGCIWLVNPQTGARIYKFIQSIDVNTRLSIVGVFCIINLALLLIINGKLGIKLLSFYTVIDNMIVEKNKLKPIGKAIELKNHRR